MSSSSIDIPEHLYQNNRNPDQKFNQDEKLFRRFDSCHFDNNNQVLVEAIRFPDFSVDREKYCFSYEDVLIPKWNNWGIFSFLVKDIPNDNFPPVSPCEYTFKVFHIPLIDHYPHSEVRTLKDKEYDKRLKIPKEIKKIFRMRLLQKINILKTPT